MKIDFGQTKVYADNQSCIKLVENEKFSNRTKYIDTRYHFIREMRTRGDVDLEYVPSEENIADLLTKTLGPKKTSDMRARINLVC